MSGLGLAGQLPALQVVLPLIAAPIAFILRRGTLVWAFSTLVAWATLAVSWALLGSEKEGASTGACIRRATR